jgi:hypothetical protein
MTNVPHHSRTRVTKDLTFYHYPPSIDLLINDAAAASDSRLTSVVGLVHGEGGANRWLRISFDLFSKRTAGTYFKTIELERWRKDGWESGVRFSYDLTGWRSWAIFADEVRDALFGL